MKIGTCTHCGKSVTFDESRKEWLHDEITDRGNRLTCNKICFATPRRGSIEKASR